MRIRAGHGEKGDSLNFLGALGSWPQIMIAVVPVLFKDGDWNFHATGDKIETRLEEILPNDFILTFCDEETATKDELHYIVRVENAEDLKLIQAEYRCGNPYIPAPPEPAGPPPEWMLRFVADRS